MDAMKNRKSAPARVRSTRADTAQERHAVSVHAWHTFLDEYRAARHALRLQEHEECFHRGHGDRTWDLLPSLLRYCKKRKLATSTEIGEIEASLFFEFRARAKEMHSGQQTGWDILFGMQHFGTPTRLLDWTDTFGVALYFALQQVTADSQPCIWLLNPYALNEKTRKVRDLVAPEYLFDDDEDFGDYLANYRKLPWDKPVAIYPEQRNDRIHAQRGFFTIFGDRLETLDTLAPSALRQVEIPVEAIPAAREFFELSGINEHQLFPDLSGLSRHLKLKYGIH